MIDKILVFGTSIVYGARDPEGGWVQRLRRFLKENYNTKGKANIKVYNLGVSAQDSGHVLKRFEFETQQRSKKKEGTMIILSVGINDTQGLTTEKYGTSPSEYKNNITKLLKLARNYAEKVLFVGLNQVDEARTCPIFWNKEVYFKNSAVKQYDQIAKEVCFEKKVDFIDLINQLDSDLLQDGLHPNAEGHEKIYQIVKEFLIKNKVIE